MSFAHVAVVALWASFIGLLVLAADAVETATDIAPWAQIGINGILVWYLIHRTKSDPQERKEQRAHVEIIAANHAEAMAAQAREQAAVIKEIRDECKLERQEFLVEIRTERAIRSEHEERRRLSERQLHKDHVLLVESMNRIRDLLSQKIDWGREVDAAEEDGGSET